MTSCNFSIVTLFNKSKKRLFFVFWWTVTDSSRISLLWTLSTQKNYLGTKLEKEVWNSWLEVEHKRHRFYILSFISFSALRSDNERC